MCAAPCSRSLPKPNRKTKWSSTSRATALRIPTIRAIFILLTYDTKLDDMGGTAFPMWQLQDVFTRVLKAKRVVTFADTCHSYGFSGERRGKKSNNLVNQYVAKAANDSDRAVITASDISQLSYESDKWGGGHGVFTFFLLKGLHGEADFNKDGTVTAGELFSYIHDNVDKATEGNQSPMAVPGLAERIPLSGVAVRKSANASAVAARDRSIFFRPSSRLLPTRRDHLPQNTIAQQSPNPNCWAAVKSLIAK